MGETENEDLLFLKEFRGCFQKAKAGSDFAELRKVDSADHTTIASCGFIHLSAHPMEQPSRMAGD